MSRAIVPSLPVYIYKTPTSKLYSQVLVVIYLTMEACIACVANLNTPIPTISDTFDRTDPESRKE